MNDLIQFSLSLVNMICYLFFSDETTNKRHLEYTPYAFWLRWDFYKRCIFVEKYFMVQRIQTLYLFIVIVLQSVLLSTNIAKYVALSGEEIIYKTIEIPLLSALASFTALIPAISLFLYRKRMLQMRFNIFNSILLLALQGFIVYYIVLFYRQSTSFVFSIQSVFPVISIILSILAIRNILKDELLIKSLHRLR